jgi:enolase-phosphatase E1
VSHKAAGDLIEAILLDIEGTMTPVTFVTDVLFPYARTHLGAYLRRNDGQTDHEGLLARLRQEHASASRAGEPVPLWVDEPRTARLVAVIAFVEWLMDRDRKSTALKELQGNIWEAGYRSGELVGEVFPDVRPAFQRWQDRHLHVAIFSSGSVLAQQLLLRHSSAGDLTEFVGRFFDTHSGAKVDPDSYRRIAAGIGVRVDAVLFLSDSTRELDAARTATMQTRLVVRAGNAPAPPDHGYECIGSFDEVPSRIPVPADS